MCKLTKQICNLILPFKHRLVSFRVSWSRSNLSVVCIIVSCAILNDWKYNESLIRLLKQQSNWICILIINTLAFVWLIIPFVCQSVLHIFCELLIRCLRKFHSNYWRYIKSSLLDNLADKSSRNILKHILLCSTS